LSPNTIEVTLPSNVTAASSKYRSEHDVQPAKKILLVDTPGHPKLRHMALEALDTGSTSNNVTGVVFLVDSAAISSEGTSTAELTESATYLHDILLRLQKHSIQSKGKAKDVPFLIAANKMDLFTALPEQLVKATLQNEITKLKDTRSRGIASITQSTSAEGMNFGSQNVTDEDDEGDVLGGNSAGKFDFDLLQEYGIDVTVLGGSISEGEKGVEKWWDWIAELL
jgi:signal recognition particle receptor subunit beta